MKELALGICDNPQKQSQPILKVDLLKNNIVIFGGPMSGKTTFIKSLLVRIQEAVNPEKEEENTYIIDFGGALAQYGALSTVCACFDNSNEENVRRIFKKVESQLEKNSKDLKGQNFVDYINKKSNERKSIPHITLIIDNVNAFLADERYSTYQESLLKLCRDGLSKGLSVILSATDTTNGLGKFLSTFGEKIAFEMPVEKYIDIFGRKIVQPMILKGRGAASVGLDILEFQAFLPFEDEERDFQPFVDKIKEKYVNISESDKLKGFDGDLTIDNFADYSNNSVSCEDCITSEDTVVLGLDYYEHMPITINLDEVRTIAIYGKRAFGKTNLLNLMLNSIYKSHPDYRFIFIDDGRKQLEKIYKSLFEGENNVYLTNVEDMKRYFTDNGYANMPTLNQNNRPASQPPPNPMQQRPPINHNMMPQTTQRFEEKENPFTVFVVQSKALFSNPVMNKFPELASKAEEKGYLFIFSDVRKFTDPSVTGPFNNMISTAFLLDNISEFVGDRGSKSVFGEMDPKELKTQYAKCELGDGYCYDIERDELKKMKFIKAESNQENNQSGGN